MALSPQKFREIVFQLLYGQIIGHPDPQVMVELIMGELAITRKNVKLAQLRVEDILENLPSIDPQIQSVSTNYDFDRIQTVTKNILRLGIYELFYDETIPPRVAIAEAIRLSRKFGTPESATFVNAVLDHIYQTSLGQPTNIQELQSQTEILIKSEEELPKKLSNNEIQEEEASKE